ncbi:MAG TPA: PE PGRS family protein [Polyangiaceae bacterium]|nr:PE PGRS family protein [Polyangiaceae bacterium]
MRSPSLKSLGHIAAVALIQLGCAGEEAQPQPSTSTAGKTSSGGSPNSPGPVTTVGGTTGAAGSAPVGTGGSSVGVGGAPTTGAAGGSAVGGSPTIPAAGAGGAAGGAAGGGTTEVGGPINWGKEEDPSSHCPVTAKLPEYAELKADGKLPDPFTKLDGTRIKDKSEWACRRAEIVKQLAKYIYGEKPIPAKGSVTGTVSTTKISVKVTEGSKSASFDVTVSMNGATAPAPAIITYGAGAPVPSGVAKITLTAIESQGGSGAKMGPFYTFYGSDHPAGYMVAQAWQVSRIIDLLEQNPGTIDPYHIGVTGCSRNGKGAFAGGVFDNRVALTIPCESGIGGTPALRLKEQLDPGANDTAEWPYHAISYVRWLSEVALGPFATANTAAGDNTDRLPVDMHEAMALIAPRALYIVDNPSITNLDPKSAYVTGMAGKAIFTALGVPDNFAYQGAGGSHCQWRTQYQPSLDAMIDKFLKGKDTTKTGNFDTDLSSKPTPTMYYSWDTKELPGKL